MKNNHKNSNNAFPNNKNSFGNMNTFEKKNIPQGLSFAFTQNAAALTAFENMDDATKRKVIDRAGKVTSKKEMTALVQSIATNSI